MKRQGEAGLVLINVLIVLALSSAVLMVMLRSADLSTTRAQVFSDAAQGLALIQAGEASAIAVLRRDDPAADHLAEPWAAISQAETAIEGGRFALTIEDASARFNLNAVAGSGVVGLQILERLVAILDLPADTAPRILARLAQPRALLRLEQLIPEAGLAPETLQALREVVTLLPGRTEVNVNTAPPALIEALTSNPLQASALLAARRQRGFLTAEDLAQAQVILPAGTGFASQHFRVTTEVTLGQTTQVLESLLRRQGADVVVIGRQRQQGRP